MVDAEEEASELGADEARADWEGMGQTAFTQAKQPSRLRTRITTMTHDMARDKLRALVRAIVRD